MNNVDKKTDTETNQKNTETIIYIASDHAGYELKEQIIFFLESQNNKNLFDNSSFNSNNIVDDDIANNNVATKYIIKNLGCASIDSVDYPDYAVKVANSVRDNIDKKNNPEKVKGILICGTGSGMTITANKIQGIRAVNCFTTEIAEMAIRHNNANILCLGAKIIETKTALNIVRTFLNTDFDGGRHQNRINKISALDS
jgi:ribose 5-phosphate isomerase B